MIRLADITESQKERMRELVHEEVERLTETRKKEDIDRAVHTLYADYFPKRRNKSPAMDSDMRLAMRSAMDSTIYSTVRSAMYSSMYSAMRLSMESAMISAMRLSMESAMSSSMDSVTESSMRSSMRSAILLAMRSTMYSAMDSAMYSAMESVMNSTIHSAIHSAMDSVMQPTTLLKGLYNCNYWRYWALMYRCAAAAGVDFSRYQTAFDDFQDITRNATIGIWFQDFCFVFPNFHVAEMHYIGDTDDELCLPRYELHALGKPALQLYEIKLYYYHNMRIPEKYGAIAVKDWDPKWFLEEENVEYKRMLAAEMGYERIFQTLEAKEIDTYREYRLWRSEAGDVEPINILHMVCPSTGHVHYGRVPPNVKSAKLAATIYNYGLPPESFDKEA